MTAQDQAVMLDPVEADVQKAPAKRGATLQAKGVTVRPRAGGSPLSDIAFHIESGELVALTALGYTGKSALMQSLAGLLKPVKGAILIDGVDLYANLKALRPSIGYVPAELALHQGLTVAETLQDAARLRLPRRTSLRDRRQRESALLKAAGLGHVSDVRVRSLGTVDKRKLGIAMELIGDPAILLIDQPAEQLSPFDEMHLAILLRELSRQGLTIVHVDQRLRSAGISDKVIFLGPGGSLAWFGPADEAFLHLRGFVPKGIARDLFGLKEALEILANPQADQEDEWAKRFRDHEAFRKYVDDPLQNRHPDLLLQTSPLLRLRTRNSSKDELPPVPPQANAAQKLMLLIQRDFRLLWRGRTALRMLAMPPLLALVDFLLSSSILSAPGRAPVVSSMLVFLALLGAALLTQSAIFEERPVYQREVRSSSLLFPYVLSKAGLAGILAIYQGMVWAVIHFIATGAAGGLQALGLYGITFVLVAFVGGILGLVASALSRTPLAITSWVLLLTVPQLLLDGSLIPLAGLASPLRFLSGLNPSHYAVDVLLAAGSSGPGSMVVPWGEWAALAALSLGFTILLLAIQQRAGSAPG